MKKILVFSLILILALALYACAEPAPGVSTAKPSETTVKGAASTSSEGVGQDAVSTVPNTTAKAPVPPMPTEYADTHYGKLLKDIFGNKEKIPVEIRESAIELISAGRVSASQNSFNDGKEGDAVRLLNESDIFKDGDDRYAYVIIYRYRSSSDKAILSVSLEKSEDGKTLIVNEAREGGLLEAHTQVITHEWTMIRLEKTLIEGVEKVELKTDFHPGYGEGKYSSVLKDALGYHKSTLLPVAEENNYVNYIEYILLSEPIEFFNDKSLPFIEVEQCSDIYRISVNPYMGCAIIYQKLDVLPDEITEITVESTDGKEFTLTQTFGESSKEGKSGYLLYVIAIDTSEELSVATPKINIITK